MPAPDESVLATYGAISVATCGPKTSFGEWPSKRNVTGGRLSRKERVIDLSSFAVFA